MPGSPVSIGCTVVVTPGIAGPPDSGVIAVVTQTVATAGGLPLAVTGSLCAMVNSVSGAPYMLPIGPIGSFDVFIDGHALVRVGDVIPSGPGMLAILGPPAAPYITDTGAP